MNAMLNARAGTLVLLAAAVLWNAPAAAQSQTFAYYAPQAAASDEEAVDVPAQLRRQTVSYATSEPAGTIVVDTPNTYLYYGIGVGREGFTWSGVKSVERKSEWPDWIPPAEMLQRQPYLPRFMAGGEGNPLGARAMYIGGTIYRIHGTNQPSSIGKRVSSGCIRMLNEDVVDLYARVNVGTKVVVLPMTHRDTIAQGRPAPARTTPVVSSYAPVSAPTAAWEGINLRRVY